MMTPAMKVFDRRSCRRVSRRAIRISDGWTIVATVLIQHPRSGCAG